MDTKIKVFCNRCNTETNHSIKCEHNIEDTVEVQYDGNLENLHFGTYTYQIIECNGCESISFRISDNIPNYFEIDEKTGKPIFSINKPLITIYPERLNNSLPEKKIIGLPLLLKKAYREVIDGYNYDQRILCAAGLRAIVEGICTNHNINGRYLKDKINSLAENGLISKELSESLKVHKLLGDSALHRLDIPEKYELESAIHLIELTLETLYSVPIHHKDLKSLVVKRISK